MFPGYDLGETTQRIADGIFSQIKDYEYGIQFARLSKPHKKGAGALSVRFKTYALRHAPFQVTLNSRGFTSYQDNTKTGIIYR